jgi:hypothetical protein
MAVSQLREYSGSGQVVAVIICGTRYGLRSDGRPENPQLNQRAARRVRYARERHVIPMLPEPAPVPSIDDFEPTACSFGTEPSLWTVNAEDAFTFESGGDRMEWDL